MVLPILLIITTSFAQPNKSVNLCTFTKDCIKLATVCDGVIAINRAHKAEWQAQVKKDMMTATCQEKLREEKETNKKLVPFCANNICELR